MSNSKKHGGFTLLEVVISMALIAIMSVGVYNAFGIMIKQTKAGQMKQTSALIGKQISEEIKSVAEKKITKDVPSSMYELTNTIQFTKSGANYDSDPIFFNEDGEIVDAASRPRYKGEIKLEPKLANNSSPIVIGEFSRDDDTDVENIDVCVIRDGTNIKAIRKEDLSTEISYQDITEDKDMEISIINSGQLVKSSIKIDSNDPLEHTFVAGKTPIINLDLKYCTGKVVISVENGTKTPLNLCILNNNNAQIENTSGVLNEYYRSEDGNKIGTLYNVTVEIKDNRSNETKPIFQVLFAQNINMK